jgi:lysophospholipase L1-like esterase
MSLRSWLPAGMTVAVAGALLLVALACGSDDDRAASSPTPSPTLETPAASPEPRQADPAPDDEPLYIALGDSLTFGIGASQPDETGFVALVHADLGDEFGLLNLGVPGDTSRDLLHGGPLNEAIAEIERRRNDGVEGNEVALITLGIGGNDLLNLLDRLVIPGTCPSLEVSLEREECVAALQDALDAFERNLSEIVRRLQEAAPDTPLIMFTPYNPFSGGIPAFDELGVLSLEGMADTPFPEGLNDIIRAEAEASGVRLVDMYPLFEGKAGEYIAVDLIHPNDEGYRVMAEAVLEAVRELGVGS